MSGNLGKMANKLIIVNTKKKIIRTVATGKHSLEKYYLKMHNNFSCHIIILTTVHTIYGQCGKVSIKNAIFWDVTPCGCCKN
jgi:hypothetical protein